MQSRSGDQAGGLARVLLAHGFRPFFVLAAAYAVIAMGLWLGILRGWTWPGAPADLLAWHAHEMVYGTVGAAMAGFLLTAVPTFTGRARLPPPAVAVLVFLWLAGRLAMGFAGAVPQTAVAVLDLAFPSALCLVVARDIVASRSHRNLVLVAILTLFVAADGAFHLRGRVASLAPLAALAPHVVVLLVAVIGGRITPTFTANWMRARGLSPLPVSYPALEAAVLASTIAAAAADVLAPHAALTGLVALGAGILHGARLAGWRTRAVLGDALLLVLHAGYLWLALGYALLGIAGLVEALPRSAALHVVTVGAIGTMLLGVMSRVALGHTGRPLRAPASMVPAYVLAGGAGVSRLAAPLVPSLYGALVTLAATAWIAAFGLFLLTFVPMLIRPPPSDSAGPSPPAASP